VHTYQDSRLLVLGMTRSRSKEAALQHLARLLREGKRVTVVTGAGLSAASGIPTFRGAVSSIWQLTSAAKARRSVLLADPLRWYNEFWLKHFPDSFLHCKPNAGHEALANIAAACSEMSIVTQNIDGLHQSTAAAWPHSAQLAECHGRLGLYKCVQEQAGCQYASTAVVEPTKQFPVDLQQELQQGIVQAVPQCPACGNVAAPLSLMFDEDYDSHTFYRFSAVRQWLSAADAIVFVGTSFTVTVTQIALDEARSRRVPVFDFNLASTLHSSPALNVQTIEGPAEETLPLLAALVLAGREAAATTAVEAAASSVVVTSAPVAAVVAASDPALAPVTGVKRARDDALSSSTPVRFTLSTFLPPLTQDQVRLTVVI
jgi:NAD-dependent deacetylase